MSNHGFSRDSKDLKLIIKKTLTIQKRVKSKLVKDKQIQQVVYLCLFVKYFPILQADLSKTLQNQSLIFRKVFAWRISCTSSHERIFVKTFPKFEVLKLQLLC